MRHNGMGLTSLSSMVTGPIEIQQSGSHSTKNTVCVPTVIPYKHSGCRYPNTLSRSKALDQLNDADDLRGGKRVVRHKEGPIRNGGIESEQR